MLKLIFLGLLVLFIWNIGRVVYLILRTGRAINDRAQRGAEGGPYSTSRREKDITDRARIIEEESENDR